MMLTNILIEKVNRLNKIRKQKWSGPLVLAIFLIISMLLVFSFEAVGIFQKEKNLDSRTVTPTRSNLFLWFLVITIKTHKNTNESLLDSGKESETQEILFERIKCVILQTKEEKTMHMIEILKKGARDQIIYHLNSNEDSILSEDEKEFLDM